MPPLRQATRECMTGGEAAPVGMIEIVLVLAMVMEHDSPLTTRSVPVNRRGRGGDSFL